MAVTFSKCIFCIIPYNIFHVIWKNTFIPHSVLDMEIFFVTASTSFSQSVTPKFSKVYEFI